MTLEQRLEKLERENRWMRRIGAVAVALVGACVLVGQVDKELPDLVVRSLKVKDGNGRVRAWLGTLPDGSPHLRLTSEDLRIRANLATHADGSASLALIDKSYMVRAMLTTDADGSPSLNLADKDGQDRAVLGVITTADKVTGAKTTTAENTLTLYDGKGKVLWQLPPTPSPFRSR